MTVNRRESLPTEVESIKHRQSLEEMRTSKYKPSHTSLVRTTVLSFNKLKAVKRIQISFMDHLGSSQVDSQFLGPLETSKPNEKSLEATQMS
jgi:hypothetical protein